jgi:hypothetical protein
MLPLMMTLQKLAAWAGGLNVLMFVLLLLEGSGGHDGWLCEWGYDMDGAATGDTGCE